ncbi:MAG: dGTPase [Cyanobacteria bacterium RYN_339]|nr:dGTPase [Cyanobacteria bacterium RYN_339]
MTAYPLSRRYDPHAVARRDASDTQDGIDPRSPFEVDRARIVHSFAFRRLQGKTQIFGVGEGDFFRTRLTHSMEVAQVGKGLALFLNQQPQLQGAPLELELVEAACLAHDLGHPPFGHNGEEALQGCMQAHGGFEGNAQNLRILTRLESKREGFGLNLTRATLEGVLKYLQPYARKKAASQQAHKVEKCYYDDDEAIVEWIRGGDRTDRTLESQVMEWADDIAYSVHDLEDGLHSGLIRPDHFQNPAVVGRIAEYAARKGAPGCDIDEVRTLMLEIFRQLGDGTELQLRRLRKNLTSRLIHRCIVGTSLLERPETPGYPLALVKAPVLEREVAILMGVEFVLMIRNPRVTTHEYKGKQVITRLFEALAQDDSGDMLPEDVREAWEIVRHDEHARLRVVCDHISSMTDAYALKLYARLFEPASASSQAW